VRGDPSMAARGHMWHSAFLDNATGLLGAAEYIMSSVHAVGS
jgi:hypothetical protein